MEDSLDRLSAIYERTASAAPVVACYDYWRRYREGLACRAPSSDEVFIEHTYLSLLARVACYHFLEVRRPSSRLNDIWNVANGDYFVRYGLENFLGEDLFFWPFFRRSLGLDDDLEPLAIMSAISEALLQFDLTAPPANLLSEIYGQFSRPGAANVWPPARGEGPARSEAGSLVDRSCGDGALIAEAAADTARSLTEQGHDSFDVMLLVSDRIAGMSPDPVSASVARAAYLLALGELAREPHPPVLLPVYLASAGQAYESWVDPAGVTVHRFPEADGLDLPDRVAGDPMMLEWLLGRLPNYMKGAATRRRAQPEADAVQEVLNAYYIYLTSAKARTPIPEPLTPAAADVMVETARILVTGYLHGQGHALLHLVKNAPASLFLARRHFDVVFDG